MEDRLRGAGAGRRPAARAAWRAGRRGPARRRRRDHRAAAADPAAGHADRRQPRPARPHHAADAAAQRLSRRLSRISRISTCSRPASARRGCCSTCWRAGAGRSMALAKRPMIVSAGLHPHHRRAVARRSSRRPAAWRELARCCTPRCFRCSPGSTCPTSASPRWSAPTTPRRRSRAAEQLADMAWQRRARVRARARAARRCHPHRPRLRRHDRGQRCRRCADRGLRGRQRRGAERAAGRRRRRGAGGSPI